MKASHELDKQRLGKLLGSPGLFRAGILILVLLLLAMILFGLLAGSLITAKFFPNAQL